MSSPPCCRNAIIILSLFTFIYLGSCRKLQDEVQKYPPAEIRSGTYQRTDIPGAEPEPIALGVIGVVINRQNNTAIFKLKDASEITAPLVDSPAWEEGCPTNVGATRMEILFFDMDSLVLDGVLFENPVFIATCPASSTFVLRESGSSTGGPLPAVACDWWTGAKCIYFSQQEVLSP